MKLLRIIDKETHLFLRDDFTYDETCEIGIDAEPDNQSGFAWPRWDFEQGKWVEGAE